MTHWGVVVVPFDCQLDNVKSHGKGVSVRDVWITLACGHAWGGFLNRVNWGGKNVLALIRPASFHGRGPAE